MSARSCSNCFYFEERTSFCRRFPPQPVMGRNWNSSDEEVVFSATIFPKIDRPTMDYCGEWERR